MAEQHHDRYAATPLADAPTAVVDTAGAPDDTADADTDRRPVAQRDPAVTAD